MNKSNRSRAFAALALSLTLGVGSVGEAFARIGTSSPPAAARSTSVASSSARIGGGNSVGMSRPNVMQSVRAPSAAPAAPAVQPQRQAPVATSNYGNSGSSRSSESGKKTPNWVAPAVAGVAGMAAGYAIANAGNNNNHPVQQGYPNAPQGYPAAPQGYSQPAPVYAPEPQPAPVYQQPAPVYQQPAPVYQQPAPVYQQPVQRPVEQAPASSSSVGGFLLLMLLLGALGGAAYWMTRKNKGLSDSSSFPGSSGVATSRVSGAQANASSEPRDRVSLSKTKEANVNVQDADSRMAFYETLQQLNNQGDLAALEAITTADMFDAIKESIVSRQGASTTTVISVYSQVVDTTYEAGQTICSISYEAVIRENNGPQEAVNEVWHLVQKEGSTSWKLAGIEQV